jgi:outer membrane protein W
MRGLALSLLLAAGPAAAQDNEISVFLGATTAGGIDRAARGIEEVTVGGGFTWGVQAGRFFTPRLGAEVLWMRQETGVDVATSAGEQRVFDACVDQVVGHAVFRFRGPEARVRPFAMAGLGAAFFSADDLPTETKLTISLGGGVKADIGHGLALRAQVRFNPSFLSDEDAEPFCDPFGFCQGTLSQFEASAGVVFRF